MFFVVMFCFKGGQTMIKVGMCSQESGFEFREGKSGVTFRLCVLNRGTFVCTHTKEPDVILL